MEQPLGSLASGDWEWIRPSMLKMIRTAKSRLQRENRNGNGAENDEAEEQQHSARQHRPTASGTPWDAAAAQSRRSTTVQDRDDIENMAQITTGIQKMNLGAGNVSVGGGNGSVGGGPGPLGEITNNMGNARRQQAQACPQPQAPSLKPPRPPPQPCPPQAPMAPPPPPESVASSVSSFGFGQVVAGRREEVLIDVPEVDAKDPQQVAEYVQEIYRNLQSDERRCMATHGYMAKQAHVNAKMRGILVDWLVDVHRKYKMRPETLYLCVSIIDRYLEACPTVPRRLLQLVGVTALLIAAKFEEMQPPQMKDFVYVTDKTYSEDEVMHMEATILAALEFQICRPTAYHFLDRFHRLNGCTDAHRDLAHYVMELTLIDYDMVRHTPSRLAAAAIMLSNKLLRRKPAWPSDLARQSGLEEREVKHCAQQLCRLLEGAETGSLQAVRKKFSQTRFHAVSKLNFVSGPPSSIPVAAPPSTQAPPSTTSSAMSSATISTICPTSTASFSLPSRSVSSRPSTSGSERTSSSHQRNPFVV
eukprot:TRINITY_DN121846_c0_g1_i1.p1 TRINITY_DN121846_c0_g1~~TRINITY_DN121846_c0_g1_i1.p1  ORF type:complete len:552 (-),score=135.98 TRINITY_DN121846_c0_g1_i1:93-1685(-)